ncbi:MAG: ABC transporter substrate-binding protein [Bacteroidetes bacterium]|nr:ABC transporter substrate-binding protein [Bacteroidota bacterium]MCL5025971.1 ABC transporter substrate-binding protein [Chloroflexota bacterium]
MRARAYLAISIVSVFVLLAACAPATPTAAPAKPASSAPAAPTVASQAAPQAPATAAAAPKPAAPSPTPAPKIKRGGTLIGVDQSAADSLDPHMDSGGCGACLSVMYDGMFRLEADPATGLVGPKPELVASWEFSNPTTVLLKIQPGVKFHDGSPFDIEAFRWNLDRMLNHKKSRAKTYVEAVKSIEVVDANTMKLNLKGPTAALLANLSRGMDPMAMVSKAAVEKNGDDGFLKHPVGAGPFEFVDWIEGNKLTVKRFDGYWEKGADGKNLPYLDGVVMRIMPDTAVVMLELKARTVDFMNEFEPKDINVIKADSDLAYYELPHAVRTIPAVGFNQFKPPFDNVKLRQATQYATDKEAIAKALGFGLAVPAYYPWWAPGVIGYDESLPKYTFDQAKAKSLLAEAGYPNGLNITFSVVTRIQEQRAGEMMKNMWDAAGIRTTIESVERVAIMAKMAALEFQVGAWRGDSPPDPDVNRKRLSTKGAMNRSMVSDPALDKCLDEGGAELDLKKRTEIYKKCQTILFEGGYSLHGYALKVNRVFHKSVKGLKDQWIIPDFREVWLDR